MSQFANFACTTFAEALSAQYIYLCSSICKLRIQSTSMLCCFAKYLFISIIAVVPFTIFGALSLLELAVSFIQSYVFTVLTSSYIKEAI